MLIELASNMAIATTERFTDLVSMVGANAIHAQVLFITTSGTVTGGSCTAQTSNDKVIWIDRPSPMNFTVNPTLPGQVYDNNFTGIGAAYVRFKLVVTGPAGPPVPVGVVSIIVNTNSQ